MTKRILALLLLVGLAASASATPWGDVVNHATPGAIKPFALDLGGLLGGSAFHSGRSIGFPGFDVGVVAMTQFHPDRDNAILKATADHAFGLPLVQAEVGLPFNFDVIAHGVGYGGASIVGGGLRYGLWRTSMLDPLPDISISAFGDKLNQKYFNATHYSVNASVSWALPILHPYAGVGYDITKVTLSPTLPSVAGVSVAGDSATARGTRLTVGLDVSPLPLVHAFAAYSLRHGEPGVDIGVGARF